MPNIERVLADVEADIAAGEVQIAREREIIADLEQRGQSSAFANEILAELLIIQERHIRLRDKVRREITRRLNVDRSGAVSHEQRAAQAAAKVTPQ